MRRTTSWHINTERADVWGGRGAVTVPPRDLVTHDSSGFSAGLAETGVKSHLDFTTIITTEQHEINLMPKKDSDSGERTRYACAPLVVHRPRPSRHAPLTAGRSLFTGTKCFEVCVGRMPVLREGERWCHFKVRGSFRGVYSAVVLLDCSLVASCWQNNEAIILRCNKLRYGSHWSAVSVCVCVCVSVCFFFLCICFLYYRKIVRNVYLHMRRSAESQRIGWRVRNSGAEFFLRNLSLAFLKESSQICVNLLNERV